jgi:hypothetical protein
MKAMALACLSVAMLCAVPTASAEDENDLPGTCQGFLQATKILRQFHDPMALFEYREVSERSYEAINKEAVERGMKPLFLPTAPEGYFRRLRILESNCLREPSLLFREAVSETYLMMRQATGLSNEIPK